MISASPQQAGCSTPPKVKRDYLSYSAINTYRGCPLRYYFRYIEQRPEETVSSALVFGSAIHSAVEFWYREQLAGNPEPTLDLLLAAYQEEWRSRAGDQIKYGKNENFNSLGELAERVLVAFTESEAARPKGSILAIEEELRGPIIDGVPDLLARLDLIVETDDALVLTDFKTSRSKWSVMQAEQSSEQLLLYAMLARDLSPGKSVRLEFIVATKTKQPTVERLSAPCNDTLMTRTHKMVERVWSGIDSGLFYPSPSPMTCGSCPFQKPCREWCG